MKLTYNQKRTLEQLRKAKKITFGVIWYIDTGAAKYNLITVDGRTCNGFVKRGILLPAETPNEYILAEQYK